MVHIENITLLKKKIGYKLSDYRKRDKKKGLSFHLSLMDCIDLVKQSDGICPECKCEMLFEEYAPWCLYQFTFDAIDTLKGHVKDNLRIICYDCNASNNGSQMGSFRRGFPKDPCIRGCHITTIDKTDFK